MKTYKGYELIKAIADGEIKRGQKIRYTYRSLKGIYYYTGCNLRGIERR